MLFFTIATGFRGISYDFCQASDLEGFLPCPGSWPSRCQWCQKPGISGMVDCRVLEITRKQSSYLKREKGGLGGHMMNI